MGSALTRALHMLGVILYHLRLHRFVRRLGRNNPKVLLFHDVSEGESAYTAGLDCTLAPRVFERHLDHVAQHYRVVDIAALERGDVGPRSVAITFDDGYRSVHDHAYPALKARGFPSTVYIITDVVGNGELVWVNELNHYLHAYGATALPIAAAAFGLPADSRPEQVITAARVRYDRGAIGSLLEELRKELGISAPELAREAMLYVDWDQIAEMRRFGVTFGNHTMSHPNLAAITEGEQRAEIAGAQEVLTARIGEVTSLAYPFGHHGDETARVAVDAGLKSIAEVGGSNASLRPHGIGRVHISAVTDAGLFAQMEVVEPVKARLRHLLSRFAGVRLGG